MGVMTISEFRSDPSGAVSRAEAGEIIEITRNNRPIAELRPRTGAHDSAWNEASRRMVDLMRDGFALGGGPFTDDEKYGDATA